jgi:ABC-2 type transport system permease protein
MEDLRKLGRLKTRLFQNTLRGLGQQSLLRISFMGLFAIGFWAGLFWVLFHAFDFIESCEELRLQLEEYLFSIFFLSLIVMLLFSNGILAFSALFRSQETTLLMSYPLRAEAVVVYKFLEVLLFSSWASLVIGAPLMIAYGVKAQAHWTFYLTSLIFFLTFIFLPAVLGMLWAMLINAVFPGLRRPVVVAFGLLGLLATAFFATRLFGPAESLPPTTLWIGRVLDKVSFCQHPLLPSYWMSKGVLGISQGNWSGASFFYLTLLSNVLFGFLLLYLFAESRFHALWTRARFSWSSKGYLSSWVVDKAFQPLLFFMEPPSRMLILKDLKTFLRDPPQWSQMAIFFGLLGIYFVNLRDITVDISIPFWQNFVSFLNLTSTGMIVLGFTNRFMFPLPSLEGRKFWILALLPFKRGSILLGKFFFYSIGLLLISQVLIFVSDWMIRVPWTLYLLHALLLLALCMGLSGLSIGLGAIYPNLKEDNPAKIVSGYGGTLNLILGLIFLAMIIGLVAVPCHMYFAKGLISLDLFKVWISLAGAGVFIVAVATAIIPLRAGIRAFERLEC